MGWGADVAGFCLASSAVDLSSVGLGVAGVAQLFGPGALSGRKGEQAAGGWGFGAVAGAVAVELVEPVGP